MTHVYLIEARPLLADLRARGRVIGVFASVRKAVWEAAELHPRANNLRLRLDHRQRELLALLGPPPERGTEPPKPPGC